MPSGAGQSPSSTFPSRSMRMTSSGPNSSHVRSQGLHNSVPSPWFTVMWPARWSSYPSCHNARASRTICSRSVSSGARCVAVGRKAVGPEPTSVRHEEDVLALVLVGEVRVLLAEVGERLLHEVVLVVAPDHLPARA